MDPKPEENESPPQPPNVPPTGLAQGIVPSKVITKNGVEIYVDATWKRWPQPSTLRVCGKWPNQDPIVLLRFENVEEIVLEISDDGLYTTVTKIDAPEIYVAVFETQHLLCPNEWADPDDPFNEAIESWEAEMVLSPDMRIRCTCPTAEDKKQCGAAEWKPEPWWEQIPGEHPSLVRHKGSSREYLLALAFPDPSGQQFEEHSIYRHGDTQQELTPEEEQELKAHFLQNKVGEPVEPLLDPDTDKPLATEKKYPDGVHRETVGCYRIGIENPAQDVNARMIPVDQIHQIAPVTAEETVPTEWTEINPRRQQLGE